MEKPSSLLTFMASPAMQNSSLPSMKFNRVIINTAPTQRHKDDIGDEAGREEGAKATESLTESAALSSLGWMNQELCENHWYVNNPSLTLAIASLTDWLKAWGLRLAPNASFETRRGTKKDEMVKRRTIQTWFPAAKKTPRLASVSGGLFLK